MCHACLALRAWASLVVVVYHVYISTARTAVASVACAPVIHDAVAEVHALSLYGVGILSTVVACPVVTCAVEAWSTVLHVCQEVMMERCRLAAPYASIAMVAFLVSCVQALGKHTPLEGEVSVVIERCKLVDTP